MDALADEIELLADLVAEPGNVEHARPLRRRREQPHEPVLHAGSFWTSRPGSSGSLTMSTVRRWGRKTVEIASALAITAGRVSRASDVG